MCCASRKQKTPATATTADARAQRRLVDAGRIEVDGEELEQRPLQYRRAGEVHDDHVRVAAGVDDALADDALVRVDALDPRVGISHRVHQARDLERRLASEDFVPIRVEDVVEHARIALKRVDVPRERVRSLAAKNLRFLPRPQIHAGAVFLRPSPVVLSARVGQLGQRSHRHHDDDDGQPEPEEDLDVEAVHHGSMLAGRWARAY